MVGRGGDALAPETCACAQIAKIFLSAEFFLAARFLRAHNLSVLFTLAGVLGFAVMLAMTFTVSAVFCVGCVVCLLLIGFAQLLEMVRDIALSMWRMEQRGAAR